MSNVEMRDCRYERKFLVNGSDVGCVRLLVKSHPAMFYEPYPPRYVNNFYLDSEDFRNYFDNVDGAEERVKVRIRWYGDLCGHISKPVLEFKKKQGSVGTKYVYPFPPFDLDKFFGRSALQDLIRQTGLPEPVWHSVRDLNVVLINRYYRHYYASRDGRFRVTVDDRLDYFRSLRMAGSLQQGFPDYRTLIVELKYDKLHEMGADRIAGYFPFSVSKNSKYVTGIERVYC